MSEHFPRPWKIDPHALSIYSSETPKGCARVADLRGWGYLTGKGHGALALSQDEAIDIQRANAAFLVKAVNNHEALLDAAKALVDEIATRGTHERWKRLANLVHDLVGGSRDA